MTAQPKQTDYQRWAEKRSAWRMSATTKDEPLPPMLNPDNLDRYAYFAWMTTCHIAYRAGGVITIDDVFPAMGIRFRGLSIAHATHALDSLVPWYLEWAGEGWRVYIWPDMRALGSFVRMNGLEDYGRERE